MGGSAGSLGWPSARAYGALLTTTAARPAAAAAAAATGDQMTLWLFGGVGGGTGGTLSDLWAVRRQHRKQGGRFFTSSWRVVASGVRESQPGLSRPTVLLQPGGRATQESVHDESRPVFVIDIGTSAARKKWDNAGGTVLGPAGLWEFHPAAAAAFAFGGEVPLPASPRGAAPQPPPPPIWVQRTDVADPEMHLGQRYASDLPTMRNDNELVDVTV